MVVSAEKEGMDARLSLLVIESHPPVALSTEKSRYGPQQSIPINAYISPDTIERSKTRYRFYNTLTFDCKVSVDGIQGRKDIGKVGKACRSDVIND